VAKVRLLRTRKPAVEPTERMVPRPSRRRISLLRISRSSARPGIDADDLLRKVQVVAGLILVIRHKQNTATLGGFAALKAIQAGKDQIGGLEVLFRPSAKRHVVLWDAVVSESIERAPEDIRTIQLDPQRLAVNPAQRREERKSGDCHLTTPPA
jgi:hypothetical protein